MQEFIVREKCPVEPYKDRFKRDIYYSEYYNLVHGYPHANIVIEVTRLKQKEIEQLVDYYKGLFRYNLIYAHVTFFGRVSSVVLFFNFLKP